MIGRIAGVLAPLLLREVVGGTARRLAHDVVWWVAIGFFVFVAYVLGMVGGYQWLAERHGSAVGLLALAGINLLAGLTALLVRQIIQRRNARREDEEGFPLLDNLGPALAALAPLLLRSPLAVAILVAVAVAGFMPFGGDDDGDESACPPRD
ncbi:hypothetical protein [Niveispirillum fermenti]|uniref:hypothetical protein n=1 Tax=Niveispirillum fermenti TaxID=1233113 RepID=UPI003A8BF671